MKTYLARLKENFSYLCDKNYVVVPNGCNVSKLNNVIVTIIEETYDDASTEYYISHEFDRGHFLVYKEMFDVYSESLVKKCLRYVMNL